MKELKQMTKYNLLKFIIILLGIIAIYFYFLKDKFGEYNLKKSIQACVIAQKRTSETFDLEKSKKYCEDLVRKQIED